MKGMVFTEFLEMVEATFSADLADEIIEGTDLASGGVYTAVGTYDHSEMIALVGKLSEVTGTPVRDLLIVFGEYLFGRFTQSYPGFFGQAEGSLEFLGKVDEYIHVEVRKLYPDAELPSFECDRPRPDELTMTYRSARPFVALAEGLIRGCVAHYGETVEMDIEDLSDGEGTAARIHLVRSRTDT